MMSNAAEMEDERKVRLARIDAAEDEKRRADDSARTKQSHFIGGLKNQALEHDAGRRLQGQARRSDYD